MSNRVDARKFALNRLPSEEDNRVGNESGLASPRDRLIDCCCFFFLFQRIYRMNNQIKREAVRNYDVGYMKVSRVFGVACVRYIYSYSRGRGWRARDHSCVTRYNVLRRPNPSFSIFFLLLPLLRPHL